MLSFASASSVRGYGQRVSDGPFVLRIVDRDRAQAAARGAPLVIDELVVEHARKPRAERFDRAKLRGARIELDEHVLNEILGVGGAAREAIGEPVQAHEMRLDQRLERIGVTRLRQGGFRGGGWSPLSR